MRSFAAIRFLLDHLRKSALICGSSVFVSIRVHSRFVFAFPVPFSGYSRIPSFLGPPFQLGVIFSPSAASRKVTDFSELRSQKLESALGAE
jgi:hypothetical protein